MIDAQAIKNHNCACAKGTGHTIKVGCGRLIADDPPQSHVILGSRGSDWKILQVWSFDKEKIHTDWQCSFRKKSPSLGEVFEKAVRQYQVAINYVGKKKGPAEGHYTRRQWVSARFISLNSFLLLWLTWLVFLNLAVIYSELGGLVSQSWNPGLERWGSPPTRAVRCQICQISPPQNWNANPPYVASPHVYWKAFLLCQIEVCGGVKRARDPWLICNGAAEPISCWISHRVWCFHKGMMFHRVWCLNRALKMWF